MTRTTFSIRLLRALTLLMAGSSAAQQGRILSTIPSPLGNGTGFARHVLPLGDVDGDGVPDLAVSAPTALAFSGRVYAFSGGTGSPIWNVDGTPGWITCASTFGRDELGTAMTLVPDRTGDGVPEVLALAPGAGVVTACANPEAFGEARLFNGATGAQLVLAEMSGTGIVPTAVSGFPDVDLDGVVDIAMLDASNLQLFLGGTLLGLPAIVSGDTIVAGPFDLDGDGNDNEAVVAHPGNATLRILQASLTTPSVSVAATISGAAGSEFGATVVAIDTATGQDLLVGAPGASSNLGEVHRVVFTGSGATSTLLATGAQTGDRLGTLLATGGDFDSDGAPDFLAGVVTRKRLEIHRLSDGLLMQDAFVPNINGGIMRSIGAIGDFNADGHDDFFVGMEGFGIFGAGAVGAVLVYSGGPTSTFDNNVGPGAGQGPAGAPVLTTPYGFAPAEGIVRLAGTVPGSFYLLFAGVPTPNGVLIQGFGTNAMIFLDTAFPIQLVASGSTNTSGIDLGAAEVHLPLDVSLLGLEVGFQAMVGQPIGGTNFETVSNAISRVIGW